MVNLLVLTGGKSCEHEISIKSFENIIKFIDKTRFNIISILILKDNTWVVKETLQPCNLINENNMCFIQIKNKKINIDIIFPIVHGQGEDGSLQGFFESLNVKYVGSDICANALTFNKFFAKNVAEKHNIGVVPYYKYDGLNYNDACNKVGSLKLFIKPAESGSSFGCFIASNETEYNKAINCAKQYGKNIIIEQFIKGRELFCAVLNEKISNIGEVTYNSDFFDYEQKYNTGSHLIFPSNLDKKIIDEITTISKLLFNIFGLKTYARFDYFFANGKVYFNEVNTLPGLTETSLFLGLLNKSGISTKEIVSEIIETSLK